MTPRPGGRHRHPLRWVLSQELVRDWLREADVVAGPPAPAEASVRTFATGPGSGRSTTAAPPTGPFRGRSS